MLAGKFHRSWPGRIGRGVLAAGLAVIAFAAVAPPAAAATNLIVNGDFSTVPGGTTESYQIVPQNLPGWTSASGGIDCLVFGGVNNMCGSSYHGPNGQMATFATFPGVSPNGGNFLAADSDSHYVQAISQVISGLVSGAKYSLSFYQAGAQQSGFAGATTDFWKVTFGDTTLTSTVMSVPSGGMAGWNAQTLIFTASAASQTLTFLAQGTPNADPPFALIDGISLTRVPEPASFALFGVGLAGLAGLRRRHRSRPLA